MTTIKKKAPPKPLSTKFFADMLALELNIQSKDYDFRDIDELVQLYAVKFLIQWPFLIILASG